MFQNDQRLETKKGGRRGSSQRGFLCVADCSCCGLHDEKLQATPGTATAEVTPGTLRMGVSQECHLGRMGTQQGHRHRHKENTPGKEGKERE